LAAELVLTVAELEFEAAWLAVLVQSPGQDVIVIMVV